MSIQSIIYALPTGKALIRNSFSKTIVALNLLAMTFAVLTLFYSEDSLAISDRGGVRWECLPVGDNPSIRGDNQIQNWLGQDVFTSKTISARCVRSTSSTTYSNTIDSETGYPHDPPGDAYSDGRIWWDLTEDGMGTHATGSLGSLWWGFYGARTSHGDGTDWWPKAYMVRDCQQSANSGKKCYYALSGRPSVAQMLASRTAGSEIYWRLHNIAIGDNTISTFEPVALTETNNEWLVSNNENKLIIGAYFKWEDCDPTRDGGYITANCRLGDTPDNPLRSFIWNRNGVDKVELILDGVTVQTSPVLDSEGVLQSTHEIGPVVQLQPGSWVQETTLRVVNGATVTAGKRGVEVENAKKRDETNVRVPRYGDNAISIISASDAYATPGTITVDVQDGTIESWAHGADGLHPRVIRIEQKATNKKAITIRLGAKAKIRMRHTDEPEDWLESGKIKTRGDQSSAINIGYAQGFGSIRINTPLAIETYGARSHGINIRRAPPSLLDDYLIPSTGTYGGFTWANVFFFAQGGGDTSRSFVQDITLRQIQTRFLDETSDARSRLASSPTHNAQVNEIIKALRALTEEQFNTAKTAFLAAGGNFGTNDALVIKHAGNGDGPEIVYEIDDEASISTYGNYASAVNTDVVSTSSPKEIRTAIRIDNGGDEAFETDITADDADTVTVDPDGDGDMAPITVFKSKIIVDKPITTTGANSHGIRVNNFLNILRGRLDFDIDVSANISATGTGSSAIWIGGHSGISNSITVRSGATITGGMVLSPGADTVVMRGGTVNGAVNFGAGMDTLELQSGTVAGSVTNLETMTKTTTGVATVGDVAFDGSSLMISEGELRVSGHLNLGRTGTVTIAADSVLTFLVDRESDDALTNGRITAFSINFRSAGPNVRTLDADGENDAEHEDAVEALNRVVTTGTNLVYLDASGTAHCLTVRVRHSISRNSVGTLGGQCSTAPPQPAQPPEPGPQPPEPGPQPPEPGPQPPEPGPQPPEPGPQPPEPGPQPTAADDDDNTALYAAGAIAVIWWLMCETGAIGSMADDGGSSCFGNSQWNSTGAVQYTNTGMNSWASLQSDKGMNPVQGLAFGTNARVGENGRIGFSAMPNASGTTGSFSGSLNHSSSISGGLYSLQGEWGRDTGYASVALTHANLTAGTRFENIVSGGGMLGGEFKMRQSHLQLTAGKKLDAGGVSWTPTLGLYGGRVDQDSYSASNTVLLAKVPGYRQNYSGWKLGLRAESTERMSSANGLKWHPGVSVDMYRTATNGPRSLTLSQTDRTGALNLSDRMSLGGLPNRIVALRAGGTIEFSRGSQLRLDYVGMEMDGDVQHGALLKYQNQF